MRRPLLPPHPQQKWLTHCGFSWLLRSSGAYLVRKSAACFDSSDFAKPLISAPSAWLRYGRALHLISDSIRREPCSAVSGRYSSKVRRVIYSLCGAHHPDATHTVTSLHLWYLATKSGEEGRRGGDHVYFVIEIRRVARQVFHGPIAYYSSSFNMEMKHREKDNSGRKKTHPI